MSSCSKSEMMSPFLFHIVIFDCTGLWKQLEENGQANFLFYTFQALIYWKRILCLKEIVVPSDEN